MPELLICLYVAYLAGMGRFWHRWLVPGRDWSWATLAWSFVLGTIVWGYGQFLLNVFNLPVHGMWLYVWQTMLVVVPRVLQLVIRGGPSITSSPPVSGGGSMDPPPRLLAEASVGACPCTRSVAGAPVTARDDGNKEATWIKPVALCLIGVALLTAALQALAVPMHMWDSIVIYGFKAKILFYEQTFKTRAFLDPEVLHYSADYPLLIPYLESGFYRWLGHPDDRVVRLLFTAYWAAWLGILYDALALRLRRDKALGLVAFVATLPLFSNMYMGQASSGFADIPFALYWTSFLVCPASLLPFLAVGCVFTKNEGIPLVLIGWVLRGQYRSMLPGLLLLAPWGWSRHLLPHNAAHYLRAPEWALLAERLKPIGSSLAGEIVRFRNWGAFWFLSLLGLCWPMGPLRNETKILLTAVGLQSACYAFVYLIYPQNLVLLLPITMPRLLIHLVGPLVVALGWKFGEKAD